MFQGRGDQRAMGVGGWKEGMYWECFNGHGTCDRRILEDGWIYDARIWYDKSLGYGWASRSSV